MYLRNASMTINTSRSNTFSGGPTRGSNPKSRKSCRSFAVAKPPNTFLYGKNPRANNAIPTSCSIEEMSIRRHNSRVFIRGPFLCRPRGLVPKMGDDRRHVVIFEKLAAASPRPSDHNLTLFSSSRSDEYACPASICVLLSVRHGPCIRCFNVGASARYRQSYRRTQSPT